MLRIVQPGGGAVRDVVLLYHVDGRLDGLLRNAVGPGVLLANDTGPAFKSYYERARVPPLAKTLADLGKAHSCTPGRVTVLGFSEGVAATRSILAHGGDPDALVCVDGTHARLLDGHISAPDVADWKAYAERAKRSERVLVASATSIVTEPAYASSKAGLRSVTGWPLLESGPNDAPVRTSEGSCVVYTFRGADAPAHIFQARTGIARLLAEAMALDIHRTAGRGLGVAALAAAALFGWSLL